MMQYKPHDYQQFATHFIETHPEAAVLLECGLGKTSITLTALNDMMFDRFEVHKVLIIAPIRVCRNSWAAEIEKWDHLKGMTYSLVLGSREQRLAALRRKADLYIINRENVQWLIESSGMPFDFDMLVIDELSSFKNHQSKRFRALRNVRPFVKRIVGLTGTPCSNGLMDLWAQSACWIRVFGWASASGSTVMRISRRTGTALPILPGRVQKRKSMQRLLTSAFP